jgi:hypothetical protein
MSTMFTTADLKQMKNAGITPEQIDWQLSVFQKGPSFIKLIREATPGDGIQSVVDHEADRLMKLYDQKKELKKTKFVPASGAATRMFKSLFDYLQSLQKGKPAWNQYLETFFEDIRNFAFYDSLKLLLSRKKLDLDTLIAQKKYEMVLRFLLSESGMNYGMLPKGMLTFHRYENGARTAFEEHLTEAALYAVTPGQPVNLHFTVSSEHMQGFNKLLKEKIKSYEKKFGVKYDITFSIQKPSTDTLAVDKQNDPFRNNDGSLVFRPGGHGALIDNLNELDFDIIFIKNIDNVVPEKELAATVRYKKVLAGKLLEIQQKVFEILTELEDCKLTEARMEEIIHFIRNKLNYEMTHFSTYEAVQQLRKILDRPLRVCGVVKNTGEPGGGPFWAPNTHGDISLQIIESSQVNHSDPLQVQIFSRATHFNPVDLVCSPRTYRGGKFDLTKYIDRNTCFISFKSKEGRELKALELPGLWNGAMADWLTLFVEVPMETFNPVKTVNDLLRPQHQ